MSGRNNPASGEEAGLTITERLAQLRLARTKGIGTATFSKLMGLYGTAEQAIATLPVRARLSDRPAPAIPSISQIEDEIAWLDKRKGCHLLRSDAAYPHRLAALPNAPILLFAQGNTDLLSTPSLAIVGARKASNPALNLTEDFAAGLAEAGLTIISGLARGLMGRPIVVPCPLAELLRPYPVGWTSPIRPNMPDCRQT